MIKIVNKINSKVFYIHPNKVNYCIFPSKFCDYTQFNLSRIHPHAGVNRGVFDENPDGNIKFNSQDWDKKPGVKFTRLLEFIALEDHYTGKKNWRKSNFAKRNVNFIKSNNNVRGYSDYKDYLLNREKEIDNLFNSIIKKGIYPNENFKKKNSFGDNVSVVLTKKKQLYFNNVGHHRLSIAKILNLKEIPVKIVTAKSEKILNKFYLING